MSRILFSRTTDLVSMDNTWEGCGWGAIIQSWWLCRGIFANNIGMGGVKSTIGIRNFKSVVKKKTILG